MKPMAYEKIDALKLQVLPLRQRQSYIDIQHEALDPLSAPPEAGESAESIAKLAETILAARDRKAAVMMAYGAHLVKNAAGPLVRALIEEGFVSHLATQGAGTIHDWEFSYQGLSSESVQANAAVGRFGSWDETGRWISLAIIAGAAAGMGYGESLGKLIEEESLILPEAVQLAGEIAADPAHELTGAKADLLWTMKQFGIPGGKLEVKHPCKRYSILASAYRHRVPLTVHPGIGYDIIINHPMYHGGAIGRASTTDARIFAHSVSLLTGGVYMSVGSAIMSPQVFEKAFSAANNLRAQQGQPFIRDHSIAIVDLQASGGWDWSKGEPPKHNPAYYLRYCKTFYRMGGSLDYIQCDNRVFLANLLHQLRKQRK